MLSYHKFSDTEYNTAVKGHIYESIWRRKNFSTPHESYNCVLRTCVPSSTVDLWENYLEEVLSYLFTSCWNFSCAFRWHREPSKLNRAKFVISSVTSLVKKFLSSPCFCIGISAGEQRAHESLILFKRCLKSFRCSPHQFLQLLTWTQALSINNWCMRTQSLMREMRKMHFSFYNPFGRRKIIQEIRRTNSTETDAGEFPTKSTASDKCCAGVEVV